jgi:hypothetical protein
MAAERANDATVARHLARRDWQKARAAFQFRPPKNMSDQSALGEDSIRFRLPS